MVKSLTGRDSANFADNSGLIATEPLTIAKIIFVGTV